MVFDVDGPVEFEVSIGEEFWFCLKKQLIKIENQEKKQRNLFEAMYLDQIKTYFSLPSIVNSARTRPSFNASIDAITWNENMLRFYLTFSTSHKCSFH